MSHSRNKSRRAREQQQRASYDQAVTAIQARAADQGFQTLGPGHEYSSWLRGRLAWFFLRPDVQRVLAETPPGVTPIMLLDPLVPDRSCDRCHRAVPEDEVYDGLVILAEPPAAFHVLEIPAVGITVGLCHDDFVREVGPDAAA